MKNVMLLIVDTYEQRYSVVAPNLISYLGILNPEPVVRGVLTP
jgi:hypothetical protein